MYDIHLSVVNLMVLRDKSRMASIDKMAFVPTKKLQLVPANRQRDNPLVRGRILKSSTSEITTHDGPVSIKASPIPTIARSRCTCYQLPPAIAPSRAQTQYLQRTPHTPRDRISPPRTRYPRCRDQRARHSGRLPSLTTRSRADLLRRLEARA